MQRGMYANLFLRACYHPRCGPPPPPEPPPPALPIPPGWEVPTTAAGAALLFRRCVSKLDTLFLEAEDRDVCDVAESHSARYRDILGAPLALFQRVSPIDESGAGPDARAAAAFDEAALKMAVMPTIGFLKARPAPPPLYKFTRFR